MSTKTLERAEIKATATETDQRVIEFYALTFRTTPDKQGDIIDPGALDEWLDEFYKGGFPLPISFTHAAVRDSTDPFAIIGYAPADKEHVFVDAKGLRVRAFLDVGTNETAQQVYTLAKRGIINGASVAYIPHGEKQQRDGSTRIMRMEVLEAGPCLDPADVDASLLSVKSQMKVVDGSAWDGNRAMGMCDEASCFSRIAFEKTVGNPGERQHYGLPHHYPGRGPNAAGVRNALARLSQTQDLKDAGAARAHLEAHMREINPDREASNDAENMSVSLPLQEWEDLREKAGRKFSAANEAKLRQARVAIDELLSMLEDVEAESEGKANTEEPVTANVEEPGPNEELRVRLAALEPVFETT